MLRVVDDDGGEQSVSHGAPDRRGVGLVGGVPYARGWREAEHAAALLRAELKVWGVERRMCVRAEVSADGAGVVELGWVSPQLARLLAGLLAQARETAQQQEGQARAVGSAVSVAA